MSVHHHSFGEEIPPNIQPEPPLVQLKASSPVLHNILWNGMGWVGMERSEMGWDGMERDGMDAMGWDGMERDGMGWNGMGWGWDGSFLLTSRVYQKLHIHVLAGFQLWNKLLSGILH